VSPVSSALERRTFTARSSSESSEKECSDVLVHETVYDREPKPSKKLAEARSPEGAAGSV